MRTKSLKNIKGTVGIDPEPMEVLFMFLGALALNIAYYVKFTLEFKYQSLTKTAVAVFT